MIHKSVLLEEAINNLNIKNDGVYVDATLGLGGHSREILKRNKKGMLYAFDQDVYATLNAHPRLKEIGDNFVIINDNFANMKRVLSDKGINYVDGILFDLGVSSPQLDDASRGFSYQKDARLDMRMNQSIENTAYNVVNYYSYEDLSNIIFNYGEEKYAKSIARNICKYRENKKIETTLELVEIIKSSMPYKAMRDTHPAKRTFQAIRIEVNDELNVLKVALEDALSILNVGGRVCVITFHSLEDRIVSSIFKKYSEVDKTFLDLPFVPDYYLPKYKIVGKFTPSKRELEVNNRAHSARLRVIEKIR